MSRPAKEGAHGYTIDEIAQDAHALLLRLCLAELEQGAALERRSAVLVLYLVLEVVPLLRFEIARSLEFGQEAATPKGAAIALNGIADGPATLAEMNEILIAVDEASNVLNSLRKESTVSDFQ